MLIAGYVPGSDGACCTFATLAYTCAARSLPENKGRNIPCPHHNVAVIVRNAFARNLVDHGGCPSDMSSLTPRVNYGFALIPEADEYILANCSVPTVLLAGPRLQDLAIDHDSLARCDIVISDGRVKDICVPKKKTFQCPVVDVEGGCVFPTFVDLHTHIGAHGRDLFRIAMDRHMAMHDRSCGLTLVSYMCNA